MTLVRLLHELDCQLTALEIADALARVDYERRELQALASWRRHRDRLQVTAAEWSVFARAMYREAWLPSRKAVTA